MKEKILLATIGLVLFGGMLLYKKVYDGMHHPTE
jgi:hypothetical protein